jgi:hypothetical protein
MPGARCNNEFLEILRLSGGPVRRHCVGGAAQSGSSHRHGGDTGRTGYKQNLSVSTADRAGLFSTLVTDPRAQVLSRSQLHISDGNKGQLEFGGAQVGKGWATALPAISIEMTPEVENKEELGAACSTRVSTHDAVRLTGRPVRTGHREPPEDCEHSLARRGK